MNVFELAAKIGLDSSEYNKSLKDAGNETKSFGDKLKSGLGKAAKVGAAAIAAVGTAAVAVGKTVLDGASKVAAYGDNIDKMSQKMGISAQAYQEWDAILQHSGSSIDGMQRGMMTLSNAVVKGSDAFKKLGLSQEEVASMSQEDLFAAVIKGLQGMEEGAERTALAQELLGGAAKELGPLLNTTAEDTEAMRQRVHELGGVMSDEAVKAAAAYQDSLQDMQTAFGGLKNKLFSSFMPGITKVMDGLTEIFSGDSDKGVGLISEGIDNIITNISDKMPKLMELGGKILSAIGQAIENNLPKIMGAAGSIVAKLIVGIIKAIPLLMKQIPTLIKAIVSGLKKAWPEIKAAGIELLKVLALGMANGLGSALGKIVEIAGKVWNAVKTATTSKWNEIKASVSSAWDGIKATVSAKVEAVKAAIVSKIQAAKDAVKRIVDTIKGFFNFTASTPNIKLPHFKIIPAGWKLKDLLEGVIPELSIEWYKKAYDNPYLFTKPTVMMRGFGDGDGGEIVYGHENLMRDIRSAVGGNDELVSRIVDLLEVIVYKGVKADIGRDQLYNAVATEGRIRRMATGHSGL